jgi:ATP-binding cassette subfamily B protein RaxB
MVAWHYGHRTRIVDLRRDYSISAKGATLRQLVDIADQLQLGPRAVRCELEEIKKLRLPAMLHWDLNHFVVLVAVSGNQVEIHDPASGKRTVSWKSLSESFTGIAVEFVPAEDFSKISTGDKLRLSNLIPFSGSMSIALAKAISLSLFLQLFVLAAPFFMQTVIDLVIVDSDYQLLIIVCLGFAMLKLFEILCLTLRGLTLQYLSMVMAFDMEASVFHHLLRLPLSYFHKRFVGDVQQRFHSLREIQGLLVNASTSVLIDGCLAMTIGVVLFAYNWRLGVIAACFVLSYALIRVVFMTLSKRQSMESMIALAEEQSHFLESLRAMQMIKIMGMESRREEAWRNLKANAAQASIRFGNSNILFNAANQGLLGLSNIIVVFFAAQMVLDGRFTIGMIIAFLAYKAQFETKLLALVETIVNIKLLDVHLERVSDIVQTPATPIRPAEKNRPPLTGAIALKNVSFRHSSGEPPILDSASCDIRAGDFVALVGPSGSGKSTLIKILLGLLEPESGEVLLDSRTIQCLQEDGMRRQVGAVMQDDCLLAGTIAENINLFEAGYDENRLRLAARLSCIEEEINAMPMGFQSLVGDMGVSLSGGQVQRILLARALYHQPKILIMDEGTSHLDVATERKVNDALSSLNITRIVAAHRPETIATASRIFSVAEGSITELFMEYAKFASPRPER